MHDEPYTNNYFDPNGNHPAANVTVLATSLLPPGQPEPEVVSWCIGRPDSGRGFAIVMPHFYRNWQQADLRRRILNGIVWTAQREVPEGGVQTVLPTLTTFDPASVEPQPQPAKPETAPVAAPPK